MSQQTRNEENILNQIKKAAIKNFQQKSYLMVRY